MKDDGGCGSVLATGMRGVSADEPRRLKLRFIAPVGWDKIWRRPYFAITGPPPLPSTLQRSSRKVARRT
jgi:hypothetical protein